MLASGSVETLRGEETVEIERQLLGLALCHPDVVGIVEEEIGPTDFLIPAHGRLFAVFLEARENGFKADVKRIVEVTRGEDAADAIFADGMTASQYVARLMVEAPRASAEEVPEIARSIAREIRTAIEIERGEAPLEEKLDPETFKSRFGAVWFHQLERDDFEQHEWLIDDWLTVGDKSLVYGASGSGKSFLAMHAAFCVARGVPFFGHKVLNKGGVVYQAGEGAKGIAKRVRAYRMHHKIRPDEQLPFVLLRSAVNIWSKDGDTKALIAEIKALSRMMPVPLRMVVIDTLATATAGADENSGRDMSTVMDHVTLIAKECRCHVMLVHHKNASGERPRGHTSVFANIDNAIEVRRDPDPKVTIRTAVNGKQKDDAEAPILFFDLMRVVVGKRADGKEISSCVCLATEEKRAIQEAKATGVPVSNNEAIFYKALLLALEEHGQVAPPGVIGAPKARPVVDYARVKEQFRKLSPPEDDDPKKHNERVKKALQRAREKLQSAGVIAADSPWVWRTGKRVKGFPEPTHALAPPDDEAPPIDDAPPVEDFT